MPRELGEKQQINIAVLEFKKRYHFGAVGIPFVGAAADLLGGGLGSGGLLRREGFSEIQ